MKVRPGCGTPASCRPTTSLTSPVLFQSVPNVAVEVVVTAKHQSAAAWESHRRYAANDVVVWVHANFLVGSYIEQPTGGVVRTRRKCVSTREDLYACGEHQKFVLEKKLGKTGYKFSSSNSRDMRRDILLRSHYWALVFTAIASAFVRSRTRRRISASVRQYGFYKGWPILIDRAAATELFWSRVLVRVPWRVFK